MAAFLQAVGAMRCLSWLALAFAFACSTPEPAPAPPAPPANAVSPAPSTPRAEPLLTDMALYSVWRVDRDEARARWFVILHRADGAPTDPLDRTRAEPLGGSLWLHPSPRDVSEERVTLVGLGGSCLAHPKQLVVVEIAAGRSREALEVTGCDFAPPAPPLAIGGDHVGAQRYENRESHAGGAAARALREAGIPSASGQRALLSVDVMTTADLRIVSTRRAANEEEENLDDFSSWALTGDRVVHTEPGSYGESFLYVDDRHFVIFGKPVDMNDVAYRVYEWTGGALQPALEICDDEGFWDSDTCHRTFVP